MKKLAAAIIGFLCVGNAWAQSPSITSARRDIEVTYGFDPATMSFSEQAQRAPTITALWDRYDKAQEVYREALRASLSSPDRSELLYCDGGILLLHKSKLPDDRRLALHSISKCSLSEIEHTPYFYAMHSLALEGYDVVDFQFRILTKPRFSTYIVPHALNLGQDYAFVYPLLVLDEAKYVSRVADRITSENDPTALKSLALALFYAATPDSERRLRAIAATTDRAPAAEAARNVIRNIDSIRGLSALGPTMLRIRTMVSSGINAKESEIRLKRRARMRAISDEALIDLDAYTTLLYRSFN